MIVQNQCDRAEDETVHPPLRDEALQDFPFRKTVHYSAMEDRGAARSTMRSDRRSSGCGSKWGRPGSARGA